MQISRRPINTRQRMEHIIPRQRIANINPRQGSATIEAALVIPLLILTIVGIINIAGVREVKVRENSTENIKSTLEYLKDDATNPEDLLRLRWTAGYK